MEGERPKARETSRVKRRVDFTTEGVLKVFPPSEELQNCTRSFELLDSEQMIPRE